jgi:predicted MPP superfamily phosphohydrolase
MRNIAFVVFFSIVILILVLINYYILKRGLQVLPEGSTLKPWLVVVVVVAASAFLAGRFLERLSVNWLTSALIWIGSFWLAIMVYLLLQLVLVDLLRFLNYLFGIFPGSFKTNGPHVKEITALIILTITFLFVSIGHLNTWFPRVKHMELKVNKPGGKTKELHIAAISDVHLGTTMEKRHMRIIVEKINSMNPDIILLPGDIIDEDIAPVLQTNVGDILRQFKAKHGVFAVTGNHEYIGGVQKAKKYLADHNIRLLNDSALLVDESFYLVGREDITIKTFINKNRKPLKKILEDVDRSKPLIMMDHQPFKLNQAEENGIDLQLSGHTHNGQLWPFNYITNAIFEVSWGYKKKGETHYYVSSGVGGWGPPIRTVNRPEILSIKLIFD